MKNIADTTVGVWIAEHQHELSRGKSEPKKLGVSIIRTNMIVAGIDHLRQFYSVKLMSKGWTNIRETKTISEAEVLFKLNELLELARKS